MYASVYSSVEREARQRVMMLSAPPPDRAQCESTGSLRLPRYAKYEDKTRSRILSHVPSVGTHSRPGVP